MKTKSTKKIELIREALAKGITETPDIKRYAKERGVLLTTAYVSASKWHERRGIPDSSDAKAMQFVLKCGGVSSAIKQLDMLNTDRRFQFVDSVSGIKNARKAVLGLQKKLSS